jgi:hypothetical protein
VANKKRRNKKLRRQQAGATASQWRPDQEGPSAQQGVVSQAAGAMASAAPAPQRQAPAYAVGVSGPRKAAATAQTTTIDIDARVPYFARDLRRIAITAGLLLAAIIAASFLIH